MIQFDFTFFKNQPLYLLLLYLGQFGMKMYNESVVKGK